MGRLSSPVVWCKKKFRWDTINKPRDLGVLEVTGPNNPIHSKVDQRTTMERSV